MKFDKFTLKAQEALATAQQIAMAKSHTVLSSLHLLSAVCSDDDGIVVMVLKKIGARIREARTSKNLSQEQLAELSKLSPTYIGRLERGEKQASFDTLIGLAESLETSPLELLLDLETKRTREQIKTRIKNLVELL